MGRGMGAAVTATGLGAIIVMAFASCGPSPHSVSVTPADVSISKVGGTIRLAVEVRDRLGAKIDGMIVSYRSRDAQVATVGSTGSITAVGHGNTMVDIRVEGTDVMEFVRVVVRVPEKIDVRPRTSECHIGGIKQLKAQVLDFDGKVFKNVAVAWSSSDVTKARIENGEVVGIDEGEVVITAKALGIVGESKIRVVWAPGQKALLEQEKRFKARVGRARGKRGGGGSGGGSSMDPRLGMFQ